MSDFFDFLLETYRQTPLAEGGVANIGNIQPPEHFAAFCRKYLNDNPVVTTSHVEAGLGLRLKSGDVLRLGRPAPATPAAAAVNVSISGVGNVAQVPAVPISRPKS